MPEIYNASLHKSNQLYLAISRHQEKVFDFLLGNSKQYGCMSAQQSHAVSFIRFKNKVEVLLRSIC